MYALSKHETSDEAGGWSLLQTRMAPWRVSHGFLAITVVFLVTGIGLFTGRLSAAVGVFVFVVSGWIVSLCLHEAAHALVAYWGGDKSVVEKGYLNLDPFAYANPVMSIGLPILYLLLGGIGLPGGAVYIDYTVLRNRHWDALVSAAGPLANLVFLVVLSLPFVFGWPELMEGTPHAFWSALGFLAALQVSAVILNMLPIPGLDGFGVIRPYLPYDMQAQANQIASMLGFFLILIFMNQKVSGAIRNATFKVTTELGISPAVIFHGAGLFRLWQ